MREIKFRAWFNGEMHDEIVLMDHKYCIIDRDLGCPLNTGIRDFLSHDDPDTPMKLMQYTGLKDSNGVEIYVGAIVDDKHLTKGVVCLGEFHDMDGEYYPAQVGFYIKTQKKRSSDDTLQYSLLGRIELFGVEVIGNIYQDSHLIDSPK